MSPTTMLRSWTSEYGVSHFTTGELHLIDFTTGDQHHLWTGHFLSRSIFTTCEKIAENGEKLQGEVR